jgi:hypothetical protein
MRQVVYPGTFAEALQSPLILSGSLILMHAGTYTGDFVCTLNDVTISPYPGEHVTIDGTLTMNGSSTLDGKLRTEILYSGWTSRTSAESGSTPTDIPYSKDLDMSAGGIRNTILHDLSSIGYWAGASEFYGNIVYHIGWLGADRGHGHGCYTQNTNPTKYILNNILHSCYGWGVHVFSAAGVVDHFDIRRNIANNNVWNDGIDFLMGGGGGQRIHTATIDRNIGGVASLKGSTITLTDNHFASLTIEETSIVDVNTGNITGIRNTVDVFPNQYISGCANVAIFNEAEADSVIISADRLTGIIAVGESYKLWAVITGWQTWDGANVISGTVAQDGTITVDMRAVSYSVASPIGGSAPPTTFPQFGAFVLVKQ